MGASANYREDDRGWIPLLFASEAGDERIVRILIDYGADVNMVSSKDKISPLQRSAAKGSPSIVKILIPEGADINHQDAHLRSTPLMWAAAQGHKEVAQILLINNVLKDVRGNRGESALFLAVSAEQVDVVKLLLSFDVNKERPDIYGKTPLQKATELNNLEIMQLLTSN